MAGEEQPGEGPDEKGFDIGRRGFLAAGAGAFLCTIGGQKVLVEKAGDAAKADALARKVKRPAALSAAGPQASPGANPVDQLKFGTPKPAPGGSVREYWIQATAPRWDIIPSRPRRDYWHGNPLSGPSAFRAFTYQQMTPGFASPMGRAAMPGPTLECEVGDVLRVNFRNALPARYAQAVTMHPHGVRYTPDYDGSYIGDFTRAGGYIAPGEEFTYTWEATPESVGAWPYHDHGPNHTINTMRGLFGAIIVRPKGAPRPDVEPVLFLHSLLPSITGLRRAYDCINGRSFAGNTPNIVARAGDSVAMHVIGMDNNFHTFHVHGHRWKVHGNGPSTDDQTLGPGETITAAWTEENPGRWLYHCHVFSHQDNGMVGFYFVNP